MRILMVSAEVFPFAKTGGLADAVSALAKSLSAMGHDVRIIMPRYYQIDRNTLGAGKKNVPVLSGSLQFSVDFYKARLEKSGVTVYFVDCERCFGREGLYGTAGEPDFHDNPLRFSLLARAAFALCSVSGWYPDIMHCHDWSSCMAPVILRCFMRGDDNPFRKTKSVLTIHNMGYQGQYPSGAFCLLGLPQELMMRAGFEKSGGINFLKAGITCADIITTVSPTYAAEIQTPGGGFGLDGLIRVRSDSLFGILNGADSEDWNPWNDPYIPANYRAENMAGKKICRRALQKAFGLPSDDDVPIIGFVARLVQQKGIAEIFAPMYGCMYRMCTELRVQFAVVGSGETWCEREIGELSKKLPNMRAFIGYSEEKSRLVEAGSDFFLMPSRYEPCGLNQIYSMLYGTPPIVRRTGGLADTVEQYDEKNGGGTGFLFDDLTPDAVFNTVRYAIDTFCGRRAHYEEMQRRGMRKSFSWDDAAMNYCAVYEKAENGGTDRLR